MRLRSANVRKVEPGQCGGDSDKMTLDPQDSRFCGGQRPANGR
jgi:hypothetical protein